MIPNPCKFVNWRPFISSRISSSVSSSAELRRELPNERLSLNRFAPLRNYIYDTGISRFDREDTPDSEDDDTVGGGRGASVRIAGNANLRPCNQTEWEK